MLFPFVDSLISLFLEIDFTYPLVSVAFVVVYVILQEKIIAEDSIRKKVFEEDSVIDPLTRF